MDSEERKRKAALSPPTSKWVDFLENAEHYYGTGNSPDGSAVAASTDFDEEETLEFYRALLEGRAASPRPSW